MQTPGIHTDLMKMHFGIIKVILIKVDDYFPSKAAQIKLINS